MTLTDEERSIVQFSDEEAKNPYASPAVKCKQCQKCWDRDFADEGCPDCGKTSNCVPVYKEWGEDPMQYMVEAKSNYDAMIKDGISAMD